jgi:hypothetical protein
MWVAAIFLIVAILQASQGSYHSDLATHPDESAYFVSATCLLDYVRTAFGTNPIAFAESYYVRYPKVAFGHWPPAFFGIQALWYRIAGATAAAAMLLVGLIAAFAAFALFVSVRRFHETWIALLALAVFVALPLVRTSMSVLMPDLLASLFMFLAALAISDACTGGSSRGWLSAALWSVLAILTKESALLLLVFAPVAVILLRGETNQAPGRTRRIWGAVGLLALLLLVIYALTGVLHLRGLPRVVDPLGIWKRAGFLLTFLLSMSLAVFPIVAIGALSALVANRGQDRRREVQLKAALLWLVVALVFQVFSRDVIEGRYFLSAVFPLIIVFAHGLDRLSVWSAGLLQALVRSPRWVAPALARMIPALATVFCVTSMPAGTPPHRTGYAQVAASIPSGAFGGVILVSSDPLGEGAIIVARLVRDEARQGIVLRASKVLASSDWMGRQYQLLTTSSQEVRELLNAIPVRFVVIDMHGFIDESARAHHRLLEQTIARGTGQFRLVGDFPLFLNKCRRDGAIQVYENLEARGRRPDVVRIRMTETLGRTLELHPGDRIADDDAPRPGSEQDARIGASLVAAAVRLAMLLPARSLVEPSLRIRPGSDTVGGEGGRGQVYVTANSGRALASRSLASWITITSGATGGSDGVLRYEVARNDSNQSRSGEILIGDVTYRVLQDQAAVSR